MSDNNPYAAPKADLQIEPSNKGTEKIKQLNRFTTWGVVGLTIITLGIYFIYWMYSRTKVLNNQLSTDKIAGWLIAICVFLYILTIGLSYGPLLTSLNPEMIVTLASISLVASLINIVFFLTWIYTFRNRINKLSGSHKGDSLWLGGVLTFFISVYYFQYKINQIHDEG